MLQVVPPTPLQVFALSPRIWFLSSCRGYWNQSQLSVNFTCATMCSVGWLQYIPGMAWEDAGKKKMLHLARIPMDTSFSICCYHPVSSRYKDRNQVPRDSSDPFMGCLLLGCTLCDYKGNHRSLGFQTQVVNLLALKLNRLVLTGLDIGGTSSLEPPADGLPLLAPPRGPGVCVKSPPCTWHLSVLPTEWVGPSTVGMEKVIVVSTRDDLIGGLHLYRMVCSFHLWWGQWMVWMEIFQSWHDWCGCQILVGVLWGLEWLVLTIHPRSQSSPSYSDLVQAHSRDTSLRLSQELVSWMELFYSSWPCSWPLLLTLRVPSVVLHTKMVSYIAKPCLTSCFVLQKGSRLENRVLQVLLRRWFSPGMRELGVLALDLFGTLSGHGGPLVASYLIAFICHYWSRNLWWAHRCWEIRWWPPRCLQS